MTPKEKADKLFSRYYVMLLETDSEISEEITISLLSKQLTLIAVDEIINCDSFFKTLVDAKAFTNYWYEVQQEIKKL